MSELQKLLQEKMQPSDNLPQETVPFQNLAERIRREKVEFARMNLKDLGLV